MGRLSGCSLPQPRLASCSGLGLDLKWAAVEMLTILVLRMSNINDDFELGVNVIDVFISFALSGLVPAFLSTQGLRPGLHSCAASRLGLV